MTDDLRMKIADLERRLATAEELSRASAVQLDKLIKAHNELFDAHVRLLKSYNDNSENVGHILADHRDQLYMLTDRVFPEQLRFHHQLNRILNSKGES